MSRNDRKHLDDWILLWHSFSTFYHRFMRKYDLSMHSFHILTLLMKNPEGIEPSAIAEKLGVLRQALAPLLNCLETRNFILRRPDAIDHRRKLIIITAEGCEYAKQVEKELSELELAAFSQFPDEELSQMFRTLEEFCSILEQRG